MSANEVDTQPVQDQKQTQEKEIPSEDNLEQEDAPEQVKSSVTNDPNPANQSRRYEKRDIVHMALIDRGVRTKGTFTVHKAQYNKARAYWEYQLVDGAGRPYQGGAWIREKDLRTEKRRG